MKPAEIVKRKGGRGRGKKMAGTNLTKMYYKKTGKYHNLSPPIQCFKIMLLYLKDI
jgi:hypothetical protein